MINQLLEKLPENNRLERIWKLAQVDFKKRYYNDKFGLLWALINPITQITIYYFVFTRIFQRGQPYFALYLFSATLLWLAFSQGTTLGSKILSNKRYLTENIQFKWIDLHTSHMLSVLMGLVFNLGAYLVMLLLTDATIGKYFYFFPIVLITWYFLTAGFSILLSLIRPIFYDIIHLWPLVIMVGFWVSGIVFPGTFYFDNYSWFLHVNPFVGLLLNVRACLLVGHEIHISLLMENLFFSICLYSFARFLFNKYAKSVVENI